MQFLFQHFWLFYLTLTYFSSWRMRALASKHPSLREGYKQMAKNWVLYGSIPWLIMGLGQIVGSTQTVFEYCYPTSFNPFVVAFYLTILMLLTIFWHWIMFRGGAEFMEKHPLGRRVLSAKEARFLYSIAYVNCGIAMIVVWVSALKMY